MSAEDKDKACMDFVSALQEMSWTRDQIRISFVLYHIESFIDGLDKKVRLNLPLATAQTVRDREAKDKRERREKARNLKLLRQKKPPKVMDISSDEKTEVVPDSDSDDDDHATPA